MNNPLAGTDPTGYTSEKETVEVTEDTEAFKDGDGNMYAGAGDGSGDLIKVESVTVTKSNGSSSTVSMTGGGSVSDIGSQTNIAQGSVTASWEGDGITKTGEDSYSGSISCDTTCQDEANQGSGGPAYGSAGAGAILLTLAAADGPLPIGDGLAVLYGAWMVYDHYKNAPKQNMRGPTDFAFGGSPNGGPDDEDTGFKTDKEAEAYAKKLGYRKVPQISHGQSVFKKGNRYITRDVDGHNGGSWKMADSIKNLGRKNTRMGTYSKDLKKIGK